jgi:hypothetical protein
VVEGLALGTADSSLSRPPELFSFLLILGIFVGIAESNHFHARRNTYRQPHAPTPTGDRARLAAIKLASLLSTVALPALSSFILSCNLTLASLSPLRPRSHRLLRRLSAVPAPCSVRQSPVLRNLPLAMASAFFTPEEEEIILKHPIAKFVDPYRDGLPKDSFDQDIDKGT